MFQVATLFSTIREKLDVIPSFCFGLRQCKCRGRSGGVEDEGVEEGQEEGWRREGEGGTGKEEGPHNHSIVLYSYGLFSAQGGSYAI